jgi:hypothetical protein
MMFLMRLHSRFLVATGLILLSSLVIAPQAGYAQQKIANGAIAAQVVGRVKLNADLTVKLYGYFTAMEGVPGSIFSGPKGENTAMFTFAADTTSATIIKNGDMVTAVASPLDGQYTTLSVYYNATPSTRDLTNPDDFTQGQLVAQFRSRSGSVSLLPGGHFQGSAGLSLLSSVQFTFGDQPLNISSIVNGMSLTVFGPAPSFDSILAGLVSDGFFTVPYAGTALAGSN